MHNRNIMRDEIKAFISNKRNLTTLLLLSLMVIILPLGILLLRQQQIFNSRAAGETIKIGTGRCVTQKDGKTVLTCTEVPLVLSAPYDPNAATQSASTASPNPTTNPSPTPNTTPLPNGLVGYWKLDETTGTVINDSSPSNFDGVASGTTSVTGKFAAARDFAAGNRIDLGNSTVLNPQAALSVTAWVKPSTASLTGSKTIVERRPQTSNTGGWILGTTAGKPSLSIYTTTWVGCEATTALTGSNWEMVTGTYDGTNIKVYINGALNKTCPLTGQIAQPQASTIIGSSNFDSNLTWIGGIDDVAVYSKALSDTQVQGLITNGVQLTTNTLQSTLANAISTVVGSLVPDAVAYDKFQCTGDTTPGNGGIINPMTNGCGEILNYGELFNSCLPQARIRYKPPVWNATKKEWETIKQDGKVISQAEMKEKENPLYRIKISEPGENPPYINCQVYIEYSGRTDCDIAPQKNASGQAMGREGTELDAGQEFYMDVFRATENPRHQDQPDCRQGVEVELKSAATPTPTPTTGSPSPTPAGGSPSPTPGQCTAGTFASAQMEIPNGCGSVSGIVPIGATAGTLTYTAPNITSDAVCNLKVLTANNGDCRLDAGGKGSINNPLKPNESINVNFTNACVDNASGCTLPLVISSAAAIPADKVAYKLAESEAGLNTAQERGYATTNFTTTYTLTDSKPGMKTVYVQYIDKRTNQKKTDFVSIELVDQNPLIKTVGCQFDIEKGNITFDLTGLRFGIDGAKATANGNALDVLSHNDTTMKAIMKNAQATGDQSYKVKVTRKDNLASEEVQCRIGVAQISLGAKVFCRGQGKFNLSNVKLTIIDQNGKKVEETTTISNDGVITGLKTKFETGKKYTVSIEAPLILRRNITFTAKDGTTVITKDDGTTLILPVGDIFPIVDNGDGVINSLDQSELKRQWRNVESTNTATLTADFNQDKRVNAFDWSCMRKDFGATDDPLPNAPEASESGVQFNNQNTGQGGTGTITVEFGVPTPNPNVSPVPGTTPDSTTGVSTEEPRRFIQSQ